MGTDIHPAIEYRTAGRWEAAFVRPNEWYEKYGEGAPLTAEIDLGRNYDAFAILAGVRNGCGFAGVDTGDGFVPIAKPRGVPGDISAEARESLSDEHTPSWVTLSELLQYDWTRTTTKRGWVTAPVFHTFDRMRGYNKFEQPREWYGGIDGGLVRKISESQMKSLIQRVVGDKRGDDYRRAVEFLESEHSSTYCQVSWPRRYAEAAGELWSRIVPMMLTLQREKGGADVRLVFDFDS